MAYIPDPTDVNQPTSDVKAGTADDEFRALKAYIQGLVLGAVSQGPTVRQTALIGSQDSSGDPNFLSIGTGLAVNLAALSAPLALTYAAGSGAAGDVNYSEAIGADAVAVVAGLPPGNLNYITKLHNGAWSSTLAPCQYGKTFDRSAQMLFRWPGANLAVATTEDFGNTLTFGGNAKLSTGTQILGLNTLACDGTTDYVDVPFTSVGSGSWELFGSFRTSSLAAAQDVLHLCPSPTSVIYGILFRLTAAGKLELYASSTGSSWDIAAGTASASNFVINTTYYYRITFDALAGTYRVYVSNSGAAEVQELSVASTAKICALTVMRIGANQNAAAQGFNGFIGFTGFRRFASFTSAQAVGPTIAPTFADVKSDFFSIPQMKMYQITAESTVAGTNPTMTAINKLYLAEAVTSAGAVTGVANYAFKGKYDSGFTNTLPVNALTSKTSNIGTVDQIGSMVAECIAADAGFTSGDRVYISTDNPAASGSFSGSLITTTKNTVSFYKAGAYYASNHTANAAITFTAANWKYKLVTSRNW